MADRFDDLEVLAIGPVVSDISDAFDTYWNSDLAIPVTALGVDVLEGLVAAAVEGVEARLRDLADQRGDLRLLQPVGPLIIKKINKKK